MVLVELLDWVRLLGFSWSFHLLPLWVFMSSCLGLLWYVELLTTLLMLLLAIGLYLVWLQVCLYACYFLWRNAYVLLIVMVCLMMHKTLKKSKITWFNETSLFSMIWSYMCIWSNTKYEWFTNPFSTFSPIF